MASAMSNAAFFAAPKLTLRIHGTSVLAPVNSFGLANTNVPEIQVASGLVGSYQSSDKWYNIDNDKFVALHD